MSKLWRLLVLAASLLAPGAAAAAQDPAPPAPAHGGLPLEPTRRIDFDTDEGTWISLTLSPDGRRIVFELLGDLYGLDVRGGAATPITRGLAFDSQPAFSPDGSRIVFISDRSGSENLWVSRPDGAEARQVTRNDGPNEFVSPAWSADGAKLFVSLYRSDRNAAELWRYDADGGGEGEELTGGKFSALGAAASPDGRYLYYAAHTGPLFEDDVTLPLWSIRRRNLSTGAEETIVTDQGSAMRPVLSPDGASLAYTARLEGQTALRLRDLVTGADRLIAYPVQRDDQEALPTRDLEPGYAFTPDGRSVVISFGGKIRAVALATGSAKVIPFAAHVSLDIGPFLRLALKQDTGPVRARLVQDPVQSPDGRRIALSALGRIYLVDLHDGAARRLTSGGPPEFQPAWSPDGGSLAYVTWTAREGGRIWHAPADGGGPPRPLTEPGAYYTNPVFSPDGSSLLALRSSAYERRHTLKEPAVWVNRSFGALRQADLIQMPAAGGPARVVASGPMDGPAQFTADRRSVFIYTDQGLEAIAVDGSTRRSVLSVVGPGYYFIDHPVDADAIKISPDGRFALVQIVQQLHLIAMPDAGRANTPVDLASPLVAHRKLTSVGADFFGWADGGRTITWAVGSTYFRRPLASVALDAPGPSAGKGERPEGGRGGVEAFAVAIEAPRDTPWGALVLRGATAITMKGDEVIADADVVVVDNHIAAIGPRGKVELPKGAEVREVAGAYILPGFIDVHAHFGDVRRGVLDMENWGFQATLAYGVTAALDPSTLSIDMLAYQDLIDAGAVIGPRLYSTGTAVFSFNRFSTQAEVGDVLTRYVRDYRTHNLKEYRTGGRKVRQWVADEAGRLGLMPTTEGALDMKLDLTQVMDGLSGNEHSLSAVPLYRDVVQLFARSKVSYTLTLEISHGGPPAGENFIARTDPLDDAKVKRFFPDFARQRLFARAAWAAPRELVYPRVAEGGAKIQRAGGVVGIGSHGNYPGIGYHWELQAMASGGMTPMEVLRAATLGSAETIGRAGELGSLEPGKFADLVILARNPLEDIRNTLSIREVMKNGRLYDAANLDEVWPERRPLPTPWFRDEERGRTGEGG